MTRADAQELDHELAQAAAHEQREWYTGAQVRTLAAAHENGGRIDIPRRQGAIGRALSRKDCLDYVGPSLSGDTWKLSAKGATVASWAAGRLRERLEGGEAPTARRPWPEGAKACPICFCTPANPCTITWDGGSAVCVSAGVFGFAHCTAHEDP